jgi:translation elongation factor EF-G
VIDILLKALDRMIELLRIQEKRMQRRFEQIWKPTYSDLQAVHADYYWMFQKVYFMLDQGAREETDDGESDQWQKAIQFVKEQRVGFAPIRQKLVALVELQKDKKLLDGLSEEERHFLSQVTMYIRIKSLPDIAGTRSADLQVELERMAGMDQTVAERLVLTDLEHRIEHLGEDWIEVSKSFNNLQLALIRHSTI